MRTMRTTENSTDSEDSRPTAKIAVECTGHSIWSVIEWDWSRQIWSFARSWRREDDARTEHPYYTGKLTHTQWQTWLDSRSEKEKQRWRGCIAIKRLMRSSVWMWADIERCSMSIALVRAFVSRDKDSSERKEKRWTNTRGWASALLDARVKRNFETTGRRISHSLESEKIFRNDRKTSTDVVGQSIVPPRWREVIQTNTRLRTPTWKNTSWKMMLFLGGKEDRMTSVCQMNWLLWWETSIIFHFRLLAKIGHHWCEDNPSILQQESDI